MQNHNFLGFGLGLRPDHYHTIIDENPTAVDWFEILTENYLIPGGKPFYFLDKIKEKYPIVMHGVSMSIGSSDKLNWDYLKQVKNLAQHVNAKWISDHLCWTGVNATNLHDLMPLPYTAEAIKHVVERIKQVQDFLGQQVLIENVSSYVTYKQSEINEWEFITAIANEADCLLLLDVNNIYVSAFNHGFAAMDYINNIPATRVRQIHLAGHTNNGDHIVDTHDNTVIDEVWQLYQATIEKLGPIATMIERDDNIPAFNELLKELQIAKKIMRETLENKNLAYA